MGELVGYPAVGQMCDGNNVEFEETTGRKWQREDACFELSRLQGIEGDNRLDEMLWWSGVVCVVGVKSREGDKQSWGLGPGGKVGWG